MEWHGSVADNALCTGHGCCKRLRGCDVLCWKATCDAANLQSVFSLDHESGVTCRLSQQVSSVGRVGVMYSL
jgi:hypothetical protein